MIIGVDLLGGDLGAETTLPACRRFLEKNPNAELLVFTTRDVEVQPEPRLNVEYCESSIAMGDNVRQALKKKHSSTMGCCLAALSSGRVDGVLSLGNTGAYMALAMRIVGMSSEYSKTAICSAVPPFSSEYPIYMTDVGANVDCKPEDLLGFATMASREMCFANNPIRIGLLNVGHEDIKGSQLVKAAHQLLLDHQPDYIGYVEPKDIIAKKVNLVVTDGFNGNIYIKGISATTYHVMKHILGKALFLERWVLE